VEAPFQSSPGDGLVLEAALRGGVRFLGGHPSGQRLVPGRFSRSERLGRGVPGRFGVVGPGGGAFGGGQVPLRHLPEGGGGRLFPVAFGGRGGGAGLGLGHPELSVLQRPGDPVGVRQRQGLVHLGRQTPEVGRHGRQRRRHRARLRLSWCPGRPLPPVEGDQGRPGAPLPGPVGGDPVAIGAVLPDVPAPQGLHQRRRAAVWPERASVVPADRGGDVEFHACNSATTL
jgi:hypothetical protein